MENHSSCVLYTEVAAVILCVYLLQGYIAHKRRSLFSSNRSQDLIFCNQSPWLEYHVGLFFLVVIICSL